ncbi:unnamed protein product [Alternaria alternata]
MSNDVAKTLGYSEYDVLAEKKKFTLANGNIVESIGQISSVCSFGTEVETSATMTCVFYILLKAAMPIIMGLEFLEQTKTMTEHRERLVRVPRPVYQALSVCSVGKPRRLLMCELDFQATLAIPDTGSEIDLMSTSFASARGLEVYPGEELIELADGSIVTTNGFARADLSVMSVIKGQSYTTNETTVDFLLLDSLVHDLIVGEEVLEELKVFGNYYHALISTSNESKSLELKGIRHLGAVDRIVSKMKNTFGGPRSGSGTDGMRQLYA